MPSHHQKRHRPARAARSLSLCSIVSTDSTPALTPEQMARISERAVLPTKTHYGLKGVMTKVVRAPDGDVIHYKSRLGTSMTFDGDLLALGEWPVPGQKLFYNPHNERWIGEKALKAKHRIREERVIADDAVSDVGREEIGEHRNPSTSAIESSLYIWYGKVTSIVQNSPLQVMVDHPGKSGPWPLVLASGEACQPGLKVWAYLKDDKLYSRGAVMQDKTARRAALKSRVAARGVGVSGRT